MGRLLILEGPSGAGKTEAMKLLVRNTPVVKPITCTTRDMRPGEVNGIDYHFLTEQEFVKGMENWLFWIIKTLHLILSMKS